MFLNDYLIPGIVESNKVTDFANYRRFLQKCYVIVKPYRIKGKEIVEDDSFWNNVDSVDKHVNVGI